MVAYNYTVQSSSPTPITEGGVGWEQYIFNRDAANYVYADSNRGVTAATGTPIPPLSSGKWESGKPLFLIADAGQSAQVNVSDSMLEVVNPAAIASSILNQGLASQIAAQIKLAGVPAIDVPTSLGTFVTAPLLSGNGFTSGIVDVTAYQSVFLRWSDAAIGGYAGTDYRLFTVQWFADAGGTILVDQVDYAVSSSYPGIPIVSAPQLRGTLRKRAPYLQVNVSQVAHNANVTLNLIGSYFQAPNDALWFQNVVSDGSPALQLINGTNTERFLHYAADNVAAATYTSWPNIQPGVYSFYARSSLAFNFIIYEIDGSVGKDALLIAVPANVQPVYQTITIPHSQVWFQALSVPATTNYRITLTRQNDF